MGEILQDFGATIWWIGSGNGRSSRAHSLLERLATEERDHRSIQYFLRPPDPYFESIVNMENVKVNFNM
jgi:hypothetical protein